MTYLSSSSRPHHVIHLGPEAGVLVRVGSTNRPADPFLVEELRRFGQTGSFDEQPIPDLDSEAIDFLVTSEFFLPVRKLQRSNLKTLKLTTNYQGRTVPTIAGLLLFGVNRFDRFPDSWIQVGRFAGHDRRTILDSIEIRSPLPGAPEEVLTFLRKHSSRGAEIGPVKRTGVWTLPPVALREAVINAIVHADYAQLERPSVSLSSTTGSRSKIPDCCRLALPSKTFNKGFPNFVTG